VLLAFGLSLGPAVALGIARFAYSLLLPAMKLDLAWSYTQSGLMNTTNALGYLAGALLAAAVIRRAGAGWTFIASLAVTAAVLLITGVSEDFPLLLGLRLIPGISGATAFVAGGVLIARLAQQIPQKAGLLMGIYYGGPGVGIALSGAAIPPLVASDPELWDWAWVVLGAISVGFFLPAAVCGRVLGRMDAGQGDGIAADGHVTLIPAMLAYFLFAMGYICYMTFMFAMLDENAASTFELSGFWVLIGLATVASSRVWAGLLQDSTNGRALATLLAVVTVASALPLISSDSTIVAALSGVLFGVSFFAVVTATTSLVRRGRPEQMWARSIAIFTIFFGVGQSVGPVLGGYVADIFGDLQATMVVATGLVAAACVLALLQPDVSRVQR
jgi:predicted MFS family arabinose efflux permease